MALWFSEKDTGTKLLPRVTGKGIWCVTDHSLSSVINIAFTEVPEPNIPEEKINEEYKRGFKN